MALKTYIGVNGTARRVKNAYFGKDGKAHRVRKAYIGIGNIARPCFIEHLEYFGILNDTLSVARHSLAAATSGSTAFFAGGKSGNTFKGDVDAYSAQLTRSTMTALQDAKSCLAGTGTSKCAIFGGGLSGIVVKSVDAYKEGTRVKLSDFSSGNDRYNLAAATACDRAVFAGGESGDSYASSAIDVYSSDGTKLNSGTLRLSSPRSQLAAAAIGDYAFFGGGYRNDYSVDLRDDYCVEFDTVDIIDCYQLTRNTPLTLQKARRSLAATTIGKYVLFGGGEDYNSINTSSSACDKVDIIDSSTLTWLKATKLSSGRSNLSATSLNNNYAIFAGGMFSDGTSSSDVDVFDTALVRVSTFEYDVHELENARYSAAATTVGKYALFGGGRTLNTVEAYIAP